MKKTISIVMILLLTLAMCMSTVEATTSFTVALTASATKVMKGSEVEVTVSFKNFTAGETGINAVHLTLDYDKTVFETLTASSLTTASGWSSPTFNPGIGEIASDNSSFMAEDHDMLKIKFKVKDTAAVGNTVITIKDVDASDAVDDIYPTDQKITLTIQEKTTTPVNNNTTPNTNTNTNTNTATSNPKTGIEDFTVPAILAISALAVIAYIRYRKLEK